MSCFENESKALLEPKVTFGQYPKISFLSITIKYLLRSFLKQKSFPSYTSRYLEIYIIFIYIICILQKYSKVQFELLSMHSNFEEPLHLIQL